MPFTITPVARPPCCSPFPDFLPTPAHQAASAGPQGVCAQSVRCMSVCPASPPGFRGVASWACLSSEPLTMPPVVRGRDTVLLDGCPSDSLGSPCSEASLGSDCASPSLHKNPVNSGGPETPSPPSPGAPDRVIFHPPPTCALAGRLHLRVCWAPSQSRTEALCPGCTEAERSCLQGLPATQL